MGKYDILDFRLCWLFDFWPNGTSYISEVLGALSLARYVSRAITSQMKWTTQLNGENIIFPRYNHILNWNVSLLEFAKANWCRIDTLGFSSVCKGNRQLKKVTHASDHWSLACWYLFGSPIYDEWAPLISK